MQAGPDIDIRVVDTTADAELARHVEFERRHGLPRHEVDELRAWLPTVSGAVLLAAWDEAGAQVGCATASTMREIPTCVHLNAFVEPGRADVLRALAGWLEHWPGSAGAQWLLAHVNEPTPEQQQVWQAAGFEYVGDRARMVRTVGLADRDLDVPAPDGMRVIPLAERPDLAERTLAVWNRCHVDIPSPIPFAASTYDEWRLEIGVEPDEPFPPSLLVALTPEDDVAGAALLLAIDEAKTVYGHRFTAVAPEHRGRGVAQALKLAIIRWAAHNGVHELRASNDSNNAPMRAVNDRLGYEPQFRIAMYQRPLAP